MAIVGRTPEVDESPSTTSITGTLPTDRVTGDIVIACYSFTGDATGTLTGPSGWTQLHTPTAHASGDYVTLASYYRFDPPSAPTASYTGTAGAATVICQAYGGVDSTTPLDVASVVSTATGTSIAATGVTIATAGARLISAHAENNRTRTAVIPSGMTQVAQYSAAGGTTGGRFLAVADEVRSTTGATGTRTWANSPANSNNMVAFVGALRPAATTAAVTASSTFAMLVDATVTPGSPQVTITETFSITAAASRGQSGSVTLASTFGASIAATVSRVAASTPITCTLEAEFVPSVWTDITDDVSYRSGPLTIRQGRPTEYDDVAGAVMSFALWNDDGRFMPGNTGSPIYPAWGKGVRVRWIVSKNGTDYTRFVGWVQAIAPDYPGDSLSDAIVSVTAVDALGLLAQRKLRSNLTEVSLWRARNDTSWCDAYEASGSTSGQVALLTNYSQDATPGSPSAQYAAADSALNFGTENDLSVGGIVTAGGQQTTKTLMGLQATSYQIKLHLKGPTQQVSAAATYYQCARFASIGVLAVVQSGSDNSLVLRNDANTSTVGTIGTLPKGQWVEVVAYSRSDNRARSDWQMTLTDGTTTTLSNVNVDIRNTASVWFPGNATPSLDCSASGVVALGTDTPINVEEAFTAVENGTVSTRVDMVANVVDEMPVTLAQVGTLTGAVSTGRWSDRSAFEVLQEIARTHSGIVWARSRDSVVYVIGSDQTYPTTAVATIDVDHDCIGSPRLLDGSEAQPTRVDAEWPGGVQTVRNATLETAGTVRSKRITTVAAAAAVATAAAQTVLDRGSGGIRVSQIELDLQGAAHDLAPDVLSEATTLGGLFPTVRYRIVVPSSHFGAPTKDVHVQGWTERYGPDQARITLDTTPAVAETILGPLEFTASNGSGLPGSWDSLISINGTGTTAVQTNRARETTAANANAAHYVRSGVTWSEGELVATVIPGTSSKALLVFRAQSTSTEATGYRLRLDSVNGQLVLERDAATVATSSKTLTAGTSYGVRIRTLGAYTNVRVWETSGGETGAWDLELEDSAAPTGDRWAIGCLADGTNATARSADFDDITVTTGV